MSYVHVHLGKVVEKDHAAIPNWAGKICMTCKKAIKER